MRRIAVISLVIVLMIIPVIGASCDSNGGDDEESLSGQLPILKNDDKWVTRVISEGIEYEMVIEVTGEDVVNGVDCYVLDVSIEPPMQGIIDSMTYKLEKATLENGSLQMSGEYMNTPYIASISYSYEYSGDHSYPIEVGKEYEEIETANSTFTMMGETQTETEKNTYFYKVEKIEEITVPAGTFECFKLVKYDETGTNIIEISWLSDEVKQYEVKGVDYESGDTTELLSYSVH